MITVEVTVDIILEMISDCYLIYHINIIQFMNHYSQS